MKIVACMDDNNKMMFNHRRVSQDKYVYQRIIQRIQDKKLYLSEYSLPLFKDCSQEALVCDNDYLLHAKDNYCFVEDRPLKDMINQINEIIIYKWNRKYPGDVFFDINLEDWEIVSSEDFVGNSHEIITEVVYRRK